MHMSNFKSQIVRLGVTGAAGLVLVVAPAALMVAQSADDNPKPVAQPCYNGVVPLNPYVRSCTLPGPVNKIRGSAPDANAIIACRDTPGCLSWYVNNPW
jgi:hypothetical protein